MNSVEEWIKEQIEYAIYHQYMLENAMNWHEALWGIPMGPTLTMVYPKELKGIITGR